MAKRVPARTQVPRGGTRRAQRNGTADTFAECCARKPLRVALTVIAIALVMGMMAVPYCAVA